jgi:uncharacterized protein (DUF488 family)
MRTVFTLGYAAVDFPRFVAWVQASGVLVADVRLLPASRLPAWSKRHLERTLGARYLWLSELGNRNYRGGRIDIVDLDGGLAGVRELLTRDPVVLLCVCADASTCHRSVVARLLALEGYPVVPLTAQLEAAAPAPPVQTPASLFD